MQKFKTGQKVYFYQSTGEYEGTIVEGIILSITKDLSTKKVTYKINTEKGFSYLSYFANKEFYLTSDQIYSSKKKIEKEYKDEIVYGNLNRKLNELDIILTSIYNEVKEKEIIKDNWKTLAITGEKAFSKLHIKAEDITIGDRNLIEEIDKLKKEISSIKKKIKTTKSKKPVVTKDVELKGKNNER
jgi:hypothetical protein